jgi:hypothetical protein
MMIRKTTIVIINIISNVIFERGRSGECEKISVQKKMKV